MSDHRRTVTRRAFVLPSWALVASTVLVLLGAAWLGWLVVDGDDTAAVAAPTSSPSTSPSPSPSPSSSPGASASASPSPTPTPSATASPSPSPTPTRTTPPVDRAAVPVSVLNATRTPGLARSVGATVTARGWTLAGIGNWRGYVPASTVYYPAGREAQARQLAADLGVSAVAPAPAGINQQRLTLIVVAPVT